VVQLSSSTAGAVSVDTAATITKLVPTPTCHVVTAISFLDPELATCALFVAHALHEIDKL